LNVQHVGVHHSRSSLSLSFERRTATTTRHKTAPLSSSKLPQQPDPLFNGRTTLQLITGQSLLIGAAIIAALILHTPNLGFGPGIKFAKDSLLQGTLFALPLFVLAAFLDSIEDRYPALQDVSKATQRSVIALLGGTFKPLLAVVTSTVLGLAAGFGEELLFRGVLQYELAARLMVDPSWAILISSVIFGALHAVTPLYAFLATFASVFFGFLYELTGNLAVPIICHAVYDVGALLWAHWTVTKQMTQKEREDIAKWPGTPPSSQQEQQTPSSSK
jgi:membrane protease YdiL (CAAX protease family)